MHFYVPAKAGKRPGNATQDTPQYEYCKWTATKWPGRFPVFPKGCPSGPALAALRR